MGRPQKYTGIVKKYFSSNLQKRGKCDSFKCIFCNKIYAKNHLRMAKHLLACKKTTRTFNEKERIYIKKLIVGSESGNISQSLFDVNLTDDNIDDDGLEVVVPLGTASKSTSNSLTRKTIDLRKYSTEISTIPKPTTSRC